MPRKFPDQKPGAGAQTRRSSLDALNKKITEVRRDRRAARKKESYTSVATMHRLEVEILNMVWDRAAEEEAEARRIAQESRRALSPDEIIAALVQKIRAMPESMQANIRERLGWG